MRHDRRWFGQLEQEDQRLKKHYGRSMEIVGSLELESFILTKLTKPSVPINLVGPQVSLPLCWVLASRGSIHFLCAIRRHFLACEDIAGGSDLSAGGEHFFTKYGGPSGGSQQSGGKHFFRKIRWPVQWVPAVSWRNHYFPHNKEALAAAVDPSETLHVQYTSDGSRSLTTLTSPRSIACMRPWAWCVPTVSLSRTVIFR